MPRFETYAPLKSDSKAAYGKAALTGAVFICICAGMALSGAAAAPAAGAAAGMGSAPQILFGKAPFPASAAAEAAGQQNMFTYAPEGGFIRISFSRITAPAPQSGAKQPAGAPAESRELYGLIELDLKPGWKTYWRNPGTSGFGPQIHLDGGAKAEILYPAPQLFKDGEDWTYGYKHHVALPFRLSLPQPRRAVYTGNITLGICEKLCLPQTLPFHFSNPEGEAAEAKADKSAEKAMRAALAALPKAADKNFGLIRAKAAQGGVNLQLSYPRGAPAPQLYLDGGDLQFGLPQPGSAAAKAGSAAKAGGPAVQNYFVPLLFGEAKPGAELHYTAAAGGRAVAGVIKIQP